jgi:hypothetical protein
VINYQNKFVNNDWKVGTILKKCFELIIVIPAIKENSNIKKLVNSLLLNDSKYFHKTLILFVVNNNAEAEEEIKEENSKSIIFLSEIAEKKDEDEALFNINKKSKLTFSFIDASSEGNELPFRDSGVGLARKIGMDLALNYFCYESTKSILVCLDADCEVTNNYITEIYEKFNSTGIEAASIKFKHKLEESEEINRAIVNYEIFLRYYVLGLKYANSPFSFFTIGSSMACTVEAYCKIGGMNKKKAAEDFYFMEKLSKNYSIANIDSCSVYPSARGSWRVPFGTGQRVNRFISNVQNEYVLYNPISFSILKNWLYLFNKDESHSASYYLNEAGKIDLGLQLFLKGQNFEVQWTKILAHTKTSEQLIKQKNYWFDGFKTLKLIHYLRDYSLGLSPMFQALDDLFAMSGIDLPVKRKVLIPSVEEQIKYLNLLTAITN